jgi:hypothetical protein
MTEYIAECNIAIHLLGIVDAGPDDHNDEYSTGNPTHVFIGELVCCQEYKVEYDEAKTGDECD